MEGGDGNDEAGDPRGAGGGGRESFSGEVADEQRQFERWRSGLEEEKRAAAARAAARTSSSASGLGSWANALTARLLGTPDEKEKDFSSVMRVNQLDAQTLDDDLQQLLWAGLERVFRHGADGALLDWRPELQAALSLLVFGSTVGRDQATPGLELQNLILSGDGQRVPGRQYRRLSRRQKVMLGLCWIAVPWMWERISTRMARGGWRARGGAIRRLVYRAAHFLHGAWRCAEFINFLVFLSGGRYRSLVERLLRVRTAYINPRASRALSFEFMNQYLVWRSVSQFLLFALPLVNFSALRSRLARALATVRGRNPAKENAAAAAGPLRCRRCGTTPIIVPVRAHGCRHVFCYCCIKPLMQAGGGRTTCPVDGCGTVVAKLDRVEYIWPTTGTGKDEASRNGDDRKAA